MRLSDLQSFQDDFDRVEDVYLQEKRDQLLRNLTRWIATGRDSAVEEDMRQLAIHHIGTIILQYVPRFWFDNVDIQSQIVNHARPGFVYVGVVELIHETDNAVLVEGAAEGWIPRSQIWDNGDTLIRLDTADLYVTPWWRRKMEE